MIDDDPCALLFSSNGPCRNGQGHPKAEGGNDTLFRGHKRH